jgi:hypothetical protein
VLSELDTDRGTWKRRKDIVLKVPIKSMCQVFRDVDVSRLSLGLIKPSEVKFAWSKANPSDKKYKEGCYAQLSFFNRQKDAIEEIPFDFYYHFKCADETDCPGHKLSIIDWEIGQAYREWRTKYPTEKMLLEKIEQRWKDIANTEKNNVCFYVGNLKRFQNSFMVLGVFYPKR